MLENSKVFLQEIYSFLVIKKNMKDKQNYGQEKGDEKMYNSPDITTKKK